MDEARLLAIEEEQQKVIGNFFKNALDGMYPCPPEFEVALDEIENLFA
jgi:type VI protein secretion system component VasK